MGNTYPGKIWQTFMEQAHEGLEWLDFSAPIRRFRMLPSGETDAEDAATDEGNAQGETPAENGDIPQENVTDTPDTPLGKYDGCSGILTQENTSDAPQEMQAQSSGENASDTPQETAPEAP